MDFPGFGTSHVDPDLVFALFYSRKTNDLFAYLASIPGASEDIPCQLIHFAALALLNPSLRTNWTAQPNEDVWTLHLAEYARIQAKHSRLCVPQMVGNPFDFSSDTVLRDAPMLNPLSASSSRIPGATFTPPQANSNDVLRHSAMLNQSSAPGSRIPAMTFPPQQTDSNAAPASALLSLCTPGSGQMAPHELMQNTVPPQELEQRNYGTPATGVLHAHQPGPEKFTPQMLSQNGEVLPSVNIEGMRPASEVYPLDPVILRLNLASVIPQDLPEGLAAVLIRNDNTAEFISAAIFRMPGTELALIFAAACREGTRIAESHQPITIILESHLFPLPFWANNIPCPEIEELKALLKPPHYVVGTFR